MHLFFLFGKFSFYEKSDTIFSSPFLFIKYSKTTYQKHHKHVNIQNMKVMGHIFNRIFFYGALNRGTLMYTFFFMKNTLLKCKKNHIILFLPLKCK